MSCITSVNKPLNIYEDIQHYKKAFLLYDKLADRIIAEKQWCKVGFAEHVIPLLDITLNDEEEFCALGVGSGSGELETHVLKQLLRKFPRIRNHVVEPSAELITEYKTHTFENGSDVDGVNYHWYQMLLQDYKEKRVEEGDQTKFHFISALHSLYYVDDLEKWLEYMYGLLAEGGVLLVIIAAENAGFTSIHREFPNLGRNENHSFSTLDISHVRDYLFKTKKPFHDGVIPVRADMTSCFDAKLTSQGDLLIEFLAHCIDFRKNSDAKLRSQFMEFLISDQCAEKKDGRLLLNCDCGFVAIQKKRST